MTFDSAPAPLRRALAQRAYGLPTPVQAAVLQTPPGRDLLVSAQTGSGKTVAFGLAIGPTLLGGADLLPPPGSPLALVIAPTRELALQVCAELTWLYADAGARVVSCVGGMDPRRERQTLGAGCHIVVGTPGRLRDHLERHQLQTSQLRAVVLDEADEMLDLGFRDDLEFILGATPPARSTLLFSATIPKPIAVLAQHFQRDPIRLDTVRRDTPHADIDYRAMRIAAHEAERATVNVLRYFESPGALVFCATRDAVRHMHGSLVERGFAAVALSGDMGQQERNRALAAVRDGRAQICIATDVAARGLDLPSLDLVIHADLPGSRETLLHRSGRTGRAGRKGVCVLLVPSERQRRAQTLFAQAGIAVQWHAPPSADGIRARDEERLAANPAFADPTGDEFPFARALIEAHGPDRTVAALLRLLRARIPAPEDLIPLAAPRANDRAPAPPPSGQARPPRPPKGAPRDFGPEAVRFRVALGRRNKADPKWLLPLLCRAAGVERTEIGRIEIGDRDSTFDVSAAAAERFRVASRSQGQEARITEVSSRRKK